ncbi:MAG: Tautomerase enzyme, partial [Hyphomicrobiales bacterium]
MPLQVIVTEGILSPDAEKQVIRELTRLFLDLHGLSDNRFMKPGVVGEVAPVARGRTFAGGEPVDIAIIELKSPSFALGTPELKAAWMAKSADIVERAAAGKLARSQIFANVVYAVDG